MFVLRSTHIAELATAHRIAALACEMRDNSIDIASRNARSAEDWRARALAAEGILERRANQARENFRKGRENRSKAAAKPEGFGGH